MNIVFYLDIADGFQARSCQLQTLYVSFRDLDWQVKYIIIDYIIVLIIMLVLLTLLIVIINTLNSNINFTNHNE